MVSKLVATHLNFNTLILRNVLLIYSGVFSNRGSGFSDLMPLRFIWAAQDFDYTCRDVFGSDTLKLGDLKLSDKILTLLFHLSDMPR